MVSSCKEEKRKKWKFTIHVARFKIFKAIKTVYNFSLNINAYYLYSKCMNHLKANSNYSRKQNSNITRQERKINQQWKKM